VVIVPIWKKVDEKPGVLDAASSVAETLKNAGLKVKLDDTDQRTPGWKFNFWEMKGVPLRIEIGPRDVSSGSVVISRRDIPGKQGKVFGISMEPSILEAYVKDRLDEIQSSLLQRAISFRDRCSSDRSNSSCLLHGCILVSIALGSFNFLESFTEFFELNRIHMLLCTLDFFALSNASWTLCSNIVDVSSYEELKEAISLGKWARGPWSASDADELRIKEETGATIRCFPFEQPQGTKACLMTGKPAEEVAIFAKSY
ncbi:hypothetical protein Goari_020377, partial [Gossypium aridum]|nr:hypothetical protein [Gossypium aridum]